MLTSMNGWTASTNPNDINVHRYKIPHTRSSLTMRKGVAVILTNVASDFNRYVSAIDGRLLDDWGYVFKRIEGSTLISNHSSGTAIDLNATQFPMGLLRMTHRQRDECLRIVRKFEIVTWGGEWVSTRPDEMHWEISQHVTREDVRRITRKLRLSKPIRVA